jgi:phosphoglycerate dehydrogenase-like enzyme
MRIVYWPIRPSYEAVVTSALRAEADVDLTVIRSFEELPEVLPGAIGLVMNDPPAARADELTALLAAPSTTLRWIHVVNAGTDGLDAAEVPAHIAVTSAAGAHAPVLAEHVMAFFLAFARRTPEFANATRAHNWDTDQRTSMTSLEDQTLAIVGLGHAGRELAKRAHAFGMRTVAVRHVPLADPLVDEVAPLAELHAVLARADFIALTLALTPATRHLFGSAEFAACKPTAYLVNIARGGVIDQVALAAALRAGTIAGAGLDVADPEPLPAGDPLWTAPNLIITPHLAGNTSPVSRRRMGERVTENLAKLRAGTLAPAGFF